MSEARGRPEGGPLFDRVLRIQLLMLLAAVGLAGLAVVAVRVVRDAADARRPDGEGTQRGNLGMLRAAASIYYGDNEGIYPTDLRSLTDGGKYLANIPRLWEAPARRRGPPLRAAHPPTSEVQDYDANRSRDSGMWGYVNEPRSPDWGTVFVDCTHRDSKGSVWTAY